MNRKRSLENKDLPPNLYKRKGIYYYRDVRTKIEYSVGKNKSIAITQAIQANIEILKPKSNLLDRINNVKVTTLHEWLDCYFIILEKRGLKPKSLSDYLSQIKIIKNNLPDTNINDITTKHIQEFIGGYSKQTMARLLRSLLLDSFNEAIRTGIIENNPVSITRPPKIQIKRQRLSYLDFIKIIEKSEDKYKYIFILSLLTGQRIGDIVKIKWEDIKNSKLYIEQSKTGAKIAIPINLKLNCIDFSIEDTLMQLKNKKETVCGVSIGAIRDNFNKQLPNLEHKPTFHEIRSLSARLWEEEKSAEFASKLLGHKSMKMTSKYLDDRENNYIEL